mmetsp:Transcript_8346/g.21233  ORF Transcript_8346/g.21233 Transcript_8346/m.21233 type:complete len:194 (-) Transcript_8346:104-685(-)
MLKRQAVDFESPEIAFKRRRVFCRDTPLQPVAWNFEPRQCGPQGTAAAPACLATGKRKRSELTASSAPAALEISDVARLTRELQRVREEAIAHIKQAELVNQNLQRACEDQQKELSRVSQENKMLKRSVLALNGKREFAENENAELKEKLAAMQKRVVELDRANVALCMQQRSIPACRQDGWGGYGDGGGPVF